MTLRINDMAPDFEAETTHGRMRFHEFIGNSWCVLFSHPKDFTPVCTTELGYLAGMQKEFAQRNCKIVGLSVDAVADHDKCGHMQLAQLLIAAPAGHRAVVHAP